ncbi:MAG TPA: aminoacyl-histidine dipeptidase [Terriglobales bacterium]|nr:aminoacyl-histidine dipeptidase [Terriglobales bacterium]
MTTVLADLQPKELWKHFEAITKIPRASTKEAAMREYVLGVAKRLGLETESDKVGNIVIRKPARPGREKAVPTLLQGHLDMVCEKNEGTAHNFDTDPIEVTRDGDWLKAKGTTLGADNGIGVAASLAVMESNDIAHGPLEFVFTIDEETGLTGAAEFPPGMLRSKYFLNLDNEETGTLCIGCSGGLNTTAKRKVTFVAPKGNAAFRIKVSGLKGGHSGVDIHQGRGNALRILGRALQATLEAVPVEIAELKGGSARNVIPREASAIVVVDGAKEVDLKKVLATVESEQQTDLGGFDPGLKISVEPIERPAKVLDATDAKATVDLLVTIPHGVLAMSPDIAGLVQTSTNLAVIATKDDSVEISTSQRSAIRSSILAAGKMVATACRLAGFEAESGGGYPGWKPEPQSDIVVKHQQVAKDVFGKEMKLIAMHAGLECGVIGEKYPGMQMISFGPTIVDPHSPNERVQISTVESFWKYLKAVLEKL